MLSTSTIELAAQKNLDILVSDDGWLVRDIFDIEVPCDTVDDVDDIVRVA